MQYAFEKLLLMRVLYRLGWEVSILNIRTQSLARLEHG